MIVVKEVKGDAVEVAVEKKEERDILSPTFLVMEQIREELKCRGLSGTDSQASEKINNLISKIKGNPRVLEIKKNILAQNPEERDMDDEDRQAISDLVDKYVKLNQKKAGAEEIENIKEHILREERAAIEKIKTADISEWSKKNTGAYLLDDSAFGGKNLADDQREYLKDFIDELNKNVYGAIDKKNKEKDRYLKMHSDNQKVVNPVPSDKERLAAKNERDDKAKFLLEKLDLARTAYIKKDIEAEKKSSVLWKVLKIGSLGQYGQEHENVKNEYYETLKAYKDEMLASGESMESLVNYLNMDERLNRENTRLDIKAEDIKYENSNVGLVIVNGYMRIVNSYKSIGENDKSKFVKYSKKILAGLALGGVAAVVAASGAPAGASLATATVARFFVCSVSATGFKPLFEGIAEESNKMRSSKEAKLFGKNMKTETGEADLDAISALLNEKIKKIDAEMQKQKQWQRFRTVGAVLSAVLISEFGKNAVDGAKELIWPHESISGGITYGDQGAAAEAMQSHAQEAVIGKGAEINLNIGGHGSSVESTLIEHLKNTGMDAEQAGREAHEMVLDYAHEKGFSNGVENFNLVHEGAGIKILDGKIIDIHDAIGFGNLHEHADVSQAHVQATEAVSQHAQAAAENANIYENFIHEDRSAFWNSNTELNRLDQLLTFEKISYQGIGSVPMETTVAGQTHIDELTSKMNDLRAVMSSEFKKATFSFFGLDDGADASILHTKASDYIKEHAQDKSVKIFNSLKSALGPEQVKQLKLDPRIGEETGTWSKRVITVLLKSSKN